MIVRVGAVLISLVVLASCGATTSRESIRVEDFGPPLTTAVAPIATPSTPAPVESVIAEWGGRLLYPQWEYDCGNIWKVRDGDCRREIDRFEQMLGDIVEEAKSRGERYQDVLRVVREQRLVVGNWLANCGVGDFHDWPIGCLALDMEELRDVGKKIMAAVREVER